MENKKLKIEVNKVESVGFSFNSVEVIGLDDTYCYIKGEKNYYGNTCIIAMSLIEYLKAYKEFLIKKKDHCNLYNYWCGVGGLSSDDFVYMKETTINEFVNGDVVRTKVKIYVIYDFTIDIEHG